MSLGGEAIENDVSKDFSRLEEFLGARKIDAGIAPSPLRRRSWRRASSSGSAGTLLFWGPREWKWKKCLSTCPDAALPSGILGALDLLSERPQGTFGLLVPEPGFEPGRSFPREILRQRGKGGGSTIC